MSLEHSMRACMSRCNNHNSGTVPQATAAIYGLCQCAALWMLRMGSCLADIVEQWAQAKCGDKQREEVARQGRETREGGYGEDGAGTARLGEACACFISLLTCDWVWMILTWTEADVV